MQLIVPDVTYRFLLILQDYIPAFTVKDKIRDLYKMVEEEASYRACYDMALNKLKMIASGGKDPDITIMSRILSFPGYAVNLYSILLLIILFTLLCYRNNSFQYGIWIWKLQ